MARTLKIAADGIATSETGERIGRVLVLPDRSLSWSEHGTTIRAGSLDGMAFELSTRYACSVVWDAWWRITERV